MKKIFTIAAALLASFSLWAAEPNFESYDWSDQTTAEAVIGDHDGITIGGAFKASGNVSGHWYLPIGDNLKATDDPWLGYMSISAASQIDSISIFYCPNNTSATSLAWAAWGQNVTPSKDILDHGVTSGTTGSKAWDKAVWETIDLTDIEAYTIYISRSIREFYENGSKVSNFGGGQTINVLGIRVWLASSTPAQTYTVTYKANNGSNQADVVATDVKKVADNPFIAAEGYKFVGWNTAADGSGTAYAVGAALTSDLTLYAQWAAVCYEATYDLKAGIGSAEVTAAVASIEGGALIISDSKGRITITPAEGSTFKKGDIIEFAGTVGNSSKPFGIKVGSDTYEAAEVIPNDPETPTAGGTASYTGVLKADAETLVIARDGGTTTTITSFVIKQETTCKTIVSTVETLTAVTINDVAISEANLASLVSSHTLILEDSYVTAPVVKFTKHTVITYDDESTKEKDEVIEKISQQAQASMWGAMVDIAGVAYSVYTIKPLSYTVTYKNGTETLGTETVAANGNPAEYAQYETMPLATFGGWYKDAELTQAVANMAAEVITADATYYAKFTKAFLNKNVNIEQLILDYGTKYDIKSALTDAGWAYANLNDLDTLNDIEKKDNRNYAFLGLKLKTTGAYIQGNLQADGVLVVKFGNLGCNINVSLKGSYTDVDATLTKEDLWNEDDQAYVLAIFGHAEDISITISTTGSSTVVLKQLMFDELAPVTLPAPSAYLVTCAEAENGKVEATWPDKKYRTPVGETVTLTVTPNEGYQVADVKVNGVSLNAVENVYSFTMPAEDVTVTATFSQTTGIENTDAAIKAVKVVRDGQMMILKNGVLYNMQGAVVK